MTSAWGPYGKVWGRFWTEARASGWSEDMTLLALYLLTCPHHMSEGIYVIPKAYMAEDLGWEPDRVTKTLTALTDDGFAKYDDKARVVFLPSALKYQPPAGPKQVKGAVNHLMTLPKTPLLQQFIQTADTVCPDLSILYRNTIGTVSIPLALSSISNSKKNSSPKTLSAATAEDWQQREQAVLAATNYPDLYRDLADVMASENASKKVALSRVVRALYEPLLAAEQNGSGAGFEYGLRAAIAKKAPNVNYVKKAAKNAPAEYCAKSSSKPADPPQAGYRWACYTDPYTNVDEWKEVPV